MLDLDLDTVRAQFPTLSRPRNGRRPVFLDGPGGTQVPQRVVEAVSRYLTTCNANHGGAFATSRESDEILADAHQALADLVNAASPDEIVFGANMTSLTFSLSRALGRTWKPGDVVVVTRLDHDANVRPWALAARDAGAEVRCVDINPDCTLNEDDLKKKLQGRVRLLAVTCASNAVGTVPDVKRLTQLAHEAGALVHLDAVHYAPHGLIDVRDWGCDFLGCSAYKFFGPHVGVLYGKLDLLRELEAYKLHPAPDDPPGKWMTGTQNHEGIAGAAQAVEYLASLGEGKTRRDRLVSAFSLLSRHENRLLRQLLDGLARRPRFRVWGITREEDLHRRAPTVSITCRDRPALALAEHLAGHEVYAWHGNFYALELTQRLDVEDKGGLLRLGLVHYNTAEEVERTLRALDSSSEG